MMPLTRTYDFQPPSEGLIRDVIEAHPLLTREGAIAKIEAGQGETWINDLYQVAVYDEGDMIHLNIRRRDGKPIFRDWRHFQAIKNQIVGEENEAVELYPAESRIVDTSNKYHLYVVKDSTYRFPFGFTKRDVINQAGNSPGTRQRELAR